MDLVVDKPFGIVNISKSGTTTEPAIAFRMLSQYLVARDGREVAKRRIVAITDKKRGALRRLADEQGYDTFVIPDNVGGRFSVLTPVGLLPIALAGFDIEALLQGARETALLYSSTEHPLATPAVQYAVTRQAAYRERAVSEVLVAFEPRLSALGQWWMQLFGESEGKEGKGLLPLSLTYTTDLHSMGQWIQQGPHNILETMIVVDRPRDTITIPTDEQNLDGLNYLAGETMHHVNEQAHLGTLLAHEDGGVPVLQLQLPQIDARTIGAFIYTMEYAVAVSGYMMGINPFDQPGVEDYKRNMFALLAKPGFESETKAMRQRLNK
jgi:glucose-6-phosphate isomerase